MFGRINKEEGMLTFCHSCLAVLAAYLACSTLVVLRSVMVWFTLWMPKSRGGREEQRGSSQGQRKESRFGDWPTLC
jgi:hypothetical protein